MTNPIPVQDSHEAPATFTVRLLTAAEIVSPDKLRLVAGGANTHKGWSDLTRVDQMIRR